MKKQSANELDLIEWMINLSIDLSLHKCRHLSRLKLDTHITQTITKVIIEKLRYSIEKSSFKER